MNGSDSLIKTNDVTLSLLNNEVMLNWQRANISLLGHSILIMAWATIYTNHQDEKSLLAAILVFGVLLCFLWFMAALSGNTYHDEWLDWLYYLGDQLSKQPYARLLDIWDKHRALLDGKEIKIHSKPIKLPWLALGVKYYFTRLPILFMAIYFSLLLYLFVPPYICVSVRLPVIGLPLIASVIFFICIFIKDRWKWHCKNKEKGAST